MKLSRIFPLTLCIGSLGFNSAVTAGAPDNGVPASEQNQWKEVNTATTGSNWRTKTNVQTGETLSYNPATTEIRRHPVTGKAEVVIREELEDINRPAPAPTQGAEKGKKIILINGIPVEVRELPQNDPGYPIPVKPRPTKPYQDSGAVTRYPGTYLPETGEVPPSAKTSWEAARQKQLQQQAESRAKTQAAITESQRKMAILRIQNQKVMDSWKNPQIPSNHPHLQPSPTIK